MAKEIHVGVGGVAKKVKKIYVGIGGAARKVKKVYVGINGVARLCYKDEFDMHRIGRIADCTMCAPGASASVGNYLLFAGRKTTKNGYRGAYYVDSVDAYDINLVKRSAPPLDYAVVDNAAAVVGDHAIFTSGRIDNDNHYAGTTNTYNSSLVKGTLNTALRSMCVMSASLLNYALFAGGYTKTSNSDSIIAISHWLTVSSTAYPLTAMQLTSSSAVATVANRVIFHYYGKEHYSSPSSDYRYYTDTCSSTLVVSSISVSTKDGDTIYSSAASTGNYAIFNKKSSIKDLYLKEDGAHAYSGNLVYTSLRPLIDTESPATLSMDECAIGAGGIQPAMVVDNIEYDPVMGKGVFGYSPSLIKSAFKWLEYGGDGIEAGRVGNYILFAGGGDYIFDNGGEDKSRAFIVEAYEID